MAKEGTVRCPANYIPLTPITFLERSAVVYADQKAVIYGEKTYTWKQTRDRCIRLASALTQHHISQGDIVAVLAPNVPAMYELHFGAAMAGAVLCTLNIRHDAAMLSVLLEHSEAKMIFVDYEFLQVVEKAMEILSSQNKDKDKQSPLPLVCLITDPCESLCNSSYMEYETLLDRGQIQYQIRWPVDECDPISLNYTSGTTKRPKGVVYSHRGAYLNAIAAILSNDFPSTGSVYLWTVPMFHCNGWSLAWGMAVQGGTNVCLRNVSAKAIFDNITTNKVTHMGGAPTVINMMVNFPHDPLTNKVVLMVGGAPPPPEVLFKIEEQGFDVVHGYGLTETYGPATFCTWKPEWDSLTRQERAKMKARQGVNHHGLEEVDVKDPLSMKSVPADGKTIGEVMLRGNTVMNGYFKDLKSTEEALAGGWFRTGDLGVKYSDGYVQIKDRAKDIIISGGENISTIEIESALFTHPSVLDAAVVGRPDDYWGETPCAFVKLKEGILNVSDKEIIFFLRSKLPHYMVPRAVVFLDLLPKTSTGKTQKFILKEMAKGIKSTLKMMNISKL